ncbi:MAG: hypothetical protein NFW16_01765 [Candidatus Accumulibacter sp.]|uniref:hypothetical protein n=1 Tax=Accumulibacter sp. TaxID=2053492 RepID=UPI0025864442|nr:hypothetical protein [Accumulibacter sp.]MCM8620478.1 hypothetical protein [Accumulibacter sp.]
MSLRFFAIPACNPGAAEAELNGLLAASRVLSVERQLVLAGASHRAGELQGARGASRRGRTVPTASRVATSHGMP